MRAPLPVAVALVAILFTACSSGSDAKSAPAPKSTTTTRAAPPAAPGGARRQLQWTSDRRQRHLPRIRGATPAVPTSGWVEAEYAASGTATSYTSAAPLPTDGHFQLTDGTTAAVPHGSSCGAPPAGRFNGTVVVEWLNVSGGPDAAPDYTYMRSELVRRGYRGSASPPSSSASRAARRVNVPQAAAAGAGKGVKHIDPARYGDLPTPATRSRTTSTRRSPAVADAEGPERARTARPATRARGR